VALISSPQPKSVLARHLREPHVDAGGRVRQVATPLAELRRWTQDELQQAHHDLHGEGRDS
jgi:hypothetical protein